VKAKLITTPPYPLPPCEQKLQYEAILYKSEKWSKDHGGRKPDECHCRATILINGKNLCKRHASTEALRMLMESE